MVAFFIGILITLSRPISTKVLNLIFGCELTVSPPRDLIYQFSRI